MVITRFVFEWFAGINCILLLSQIQVYSAAQLCDRKMIQFMPANHSITNVLSPYFTLNSSIVMHENSWPCWLTDSQFSALFSHMLWDIKLKFCISLYFDARKIKFECHQFPSIFAGVMPLFNFKLLQIYSFPHISYTCFDILSWNFAYDFVLLYFRSSSSVVNLRQFLLELRPFWNLKYWKYTVFRYFLLQALTYWAEIFHMTFVYFTTDQVRVSSICVNFCWSYAPFET